MSRHSGGRTSSRLDSRLQALEDARELGEGVLPDEVLQEAFDVLERASSRRSLSAGHTVVGFFGATGSGKSSLFNAVSGAEIATAAARRPTTSEPLAGVWGAAGSEALLDWLEVGNRHHASPVDGFAGEETGLILLDLPDFDSTRAANREIVQRMVGMVDVLVWVLDPQKYADDAVHNGFLAPLASHGAVTLVVLNQVDRLPVHDVQPVLDSLHAILAGEGLGQVRVLASSAVTGAGIAEVRAAIRKVAVQRQAQSRRLEADVTKAADVLRHASGEGDASGVRSAAKSRLAEELAVAANVPAVVRAVGQSYRLESVRRTGWPATRWLSRFRPDPLRRLNLRRDAPAAVNRTSLPAAGAPERARTDAAVREFADSAGAGAPGPWRAAIRGTARAGRDRLPDALDQAIAGTDLGANRKAWWWGVFNVIQWLALLTVLGGLGWLGVLAGLGYLQLPVPEAPRVEGWPVPTLMIAFGVVLGIFLAITGHFIAAGAARARAAKARRRLNSAVAGAAQELVVAPVEGEIARLAAFNKALKKAAQA
ncbi:GTP-binding protein EngB required for normal cell division [Pseudarthrobacter defluvii]|uniref:GTPase n=1 Tax=Pseudarthrobacter defluvii TaxID=410837 RepID=UPI00277F4A1C|nr:GTPase [Pseudarthrobacter defluvii]MDQ0768740.1 GTP-binding protein EngB required for normal cell division [Pseudarthrobacter defluvii]